VTQETRPSKTTHHRTLDHLFHRNGGTTATFPGRANTGLAPSTSGPKPGSFDDRQGLTEAVMSTLTRGHLTEQLSHAVG
jgi:hypothetical protein